MKSKNINIKHVTENQLLNIIYDLPKQGFESEKIHKLHKPLENIEGYENKQLILPICFDITRNFDDKDAKKDTYLLSMWSFFTDKFVNGTPIKDVFYKNKRKTHHYTIWQDKLSDLGSLEDKMMKGNLIVWGTDLKTMQEMKDKYVETGIQDLVTQYVNLHKKVTTKNFEFFEQGYHIAIPRQRPNDGYVIKKIMKHYEEIKKNVDKALVTK